MNMPIAPQPSTDEYHEGKHFLTNTCDNMNDNKQQKAYMQYNQMENLNLGPVSAIPSFPGSDSKTFLNDNTAQYTEKTFPSSLNQQHSKCFHSASHSNPSETNQTDMNQQRSKYFQSSSNSSSSERDPVVYLHESPFSSGIHPGSTLSGTDRSFTSRNISPSCSGQTSSFTPQNSLLEPDSNLVEKSFNSEHSYGKSLHSPVDKLEYYDIKNNPCGLCVIINNEQFEGNINIPDATRRLNTVDITSVTREVPSLSLKDRPGSQKDVQALKELFISFGFQVNVHQNLDKRDMEKQLKFYAEEQDHSNYDCFVCFVMSHGLEGTIYGVDGHTLQVSWIHKLFRPGKCRSLTDKPKLFFFQACQGERRMGGHFVPNSDVEHDAPSVELTFTTPNEADFLIGHSTVPGYLSFRSRSEGSWFITSLVTNLEKYHKNEDVLSILIKVNRDLSKKELKQMPMPIATLRKKVFFVRMHEQMTSEGDS